MESNTKNKVDHLIMPATLEGETDDLYREKYKMYLNPVSDRSKYGHIDGKDEIRVYTDGVFDMFHFGHARYLMQAKNMFPNTYVICGVASDKDTKDLKGNTVMSEEERCESVRHCKYVDHVICPAPWTINLDFLKKHKIDFVVQNNTPYPMGDIPDVYKPIKDLGMFLPVLRTETVSTSDYITRIISEYDSYLSRNLQRGYSRHDLNITYLKEKRLEARRTVAGVHRIINSYITDFLEYFYQPISHRIISFMSPVGSDNEDDEDKRNAE